MIHASAPGRCGLIGNPTDMYGGSVLSCSTRERARCTVSQNTREFIITVSGQSEALRSADDLALRPGDYLNVVRAALTALEVDPAAARPFQRRGMQLLTSLLMNLSDNPGFQTAGLPPLTRPKAVILVGGLRELTALAVEDGHSVREIVEPAVEASVALLGYRRQPR